MKKPTKQSIKRKLDALWRFKIKERAGFVCEFCGKWGIYSATHKALTNGLEAHHIEGKQVNSLKWNLDNGICLCYRHHISGLVAPHSDSESGKQDFHRFLVNRRGQKLLNKLKNSRSQTGMYKNLSDLEALYADLNKITFRNS